MANFKDIIGQESIKKHLQTAIKTGNLSHAYIINGEYGSGRQTIASALAKTIQCQSKTDDTDACGVCTSCKQAESHNHPDIKYITHDKTSKHVINILTVIRIYSWILISNRSFYHILNNIPTISIYKHNQY